MSLFKEHLFFHRGTPQYRGEPRAQGTGSLHTPLPIVKKPYNLPRVSNFLFFWTLSESLRRFLGMYLGSRPGGRRPCTRFCEVPRVQAAEILRGAFATLVYNGNF